MADDTQSLKSCFTKAESLRLKLDHAFSSNSGAYQENLVSAISTYEQCVKTAAQVSLFSPNETFDDVSTGNLPFFLLHYYIGDLLSKQQGDERQTILKRARDQIAAYLKLLDSYDTLSRDDAHLYERYRDAPDQFSTASTTDAAARRQTKITRYKEEKLLKQKIEMLRQSPNYARNDESTARTLHLTNITFCTYHAFQLLESIAQELQILSLAPIASPNNQEVATLDGRDNRNGRPSDDYSERLDAPISQLQANGKVGPILSRDGRPLRPFTLLDNRQRLQQGVFRPDHNLPTMTIDEYLEEERKRGGIIEGGGEQSGIRPQVDEDDMNIADEATIKARAWDDFKDDNPKGAGNTMNMG